MESLDVFLNDRKVGRLDDENGSLTFAYDAGYLSSGARERRGRIHEKNDYVGGCRCDGGGCWRCA